MDVMLARGRRGWPFFFLWVDIDMRAGDGICMDKCGFVMAHLTQVVSKMHYWRSIMTCCYLLKLQRSYCTGEAGD